MTRTRVVWAAVAICGSAILVASQMVASFALPADLRTHLQSERFDIVTSLRGLPLGVREGLQTLFGSQTLDIAEPGADFQSTTASATSMLPTRRMIAAGCAEDHHCLIYYERGGNPRTWRVALFHWRPAETRFEWGGVAPGDLKSIDAVRKAMLSGAIKDAGKIW